MRDYSEIESIISTLSEVTEVMKRQRISQEELSNVDATCQEINKQLYYSCKLKFQKDHQLDNQIQYQLYIRELGTLIRTWELTIQRHRQNPLDEEFWVTRLLQEI